MNKIESFFSVLSPTTHLSHYQMTFSLFVFIGFLEVQRFFLEKRKWFKSTFNLITLSRWMCAFVSVRATHACANMHHVTYRHRKHLSVLRDAQALSCCNKQETDTRQRYFSSIGQNTFYSRCGLSFLFTSLLWSRTTQKARPKMRGIRQQRWLIHGHSLTRRKLAWDVMLTWNHQSIKHAVDGITRSLSTREAAQTQGLMVWWQQPEQLTGTKPGSFWWEVATKMID